MLDIPLSSYATLGVNLAAVNIFKIENRRILPGGPQMGNVAIGQVVFDSGFGLPEEQICDP